MRKPATDRSAVARGRAAEAGAEAWLAARGLVPLERNFSCRFGEIDLLMRDGEELVAIEVRYRRRGAMLRAVDSIPAGKRRRIVLTASYFLQTHEEFQDRPMRFDVIALSGSGERAAVEWIKAAFDSGESA